MSNSPLAVLGLGFVLGLRHALDVDHLAAVSTIVSQGRGLWRSSLVGAVWGLGHTVSLFVAATVVIALRTEIPPHLAEGLEFCVALMLIGLGLNLLWSLLRGGRVHLHLHAHDGHAHAHPHVHAAGTVDHDHGPGRRPFFVGLVHGLAGSAALMLAVLATIPGPGLALVYVAVFGIGSIGGMMAMSTLLGVPFAFVAARFRFAETGLRIAAGLGSVAIGLLLAWQIVLEA